MSLTTAAAPPSFLGETPNRPREPHRVSGGSLVIQFIPGLR
jgi:hypothetical protein